MFSKLIIPFLILMVCTTQGCINDNEPTGPSLSVGEALPEFSVEMNDGSRISTSDLLGKVGVIVFFNTDCRDCREELPVINRLWEHFKDDPAIMIVAIAREESASQIEEYWEENGLSMPWSAQENRNVYSLFAPSVIPRIYISSPAGIVTATFDDTNMPTFSILIDAVNEAL
ncbi:MAG: TlpA family protein disulfide reductase [Muribaculaceae bacterium]|nr:TlpA family protein disulfide reductase [Muribaculaceae bacterium]